MGMELVALGLTNNNYRSYAQCQTKASGLF